MKSQRERILWPYGRDGVFFESNFFKAGLDKVSQLIVFCNEFSFEDAVVWLMIRLLIPFHSQNQSVSLISYEKIINPTFCSPICSFSTKFPFTGLNKDGDWFCWAHHSPWNRFHATSTLYTNRTFAAYINLELANYIFAWKRFSSSSLFLYLQVNEMCNHIFSRHFHFFIFLFIAYRLFAWIWICRWQIYIPQFNIQNLTELSPLTCQLHYTGNCKCYAIKPIICFHINFEVQSWLYCCCCCLLTG